MQLVCPVCTTAYTIPADKIPGKTSLATCRECGTGITIEPEAVVSLPMPTRLRPCAAGTAGFRAQRQSVFIPPEVWNTVRFSPFGDYPGLREVDPSAFLFGEIFAAKTGTYKTRINTLKAKVITATRSVLARASRMARR
jgi:predicted Zn finger-like uncharacterized protein